MSVPPPDPPRPGRGRAVTVLMVLALFAAIGAALWTAIGAIDHGPLHIRIDGEPIVSGFELASLPAGERALLVAGLLVALLAAFVVIPVALLLAGVGILLAVLSVIGLPLLMAFTVVLVLLSPLLLLIWLIWRLLRPAPNIAA